MNRVAKRHAPKAKRTTKKVAKKTNKVHKTPKRSINTAAKKAKKQQKQRVSTSSSSVSSFSNNDISYNAPVFTLATRNYESDVMQKDLMQSIHSPAASPAQFGIPGHKLRVMKLYRKMLRNTFDWYGDDYDQWVERAQELHLKVAAVKNLEDVSTIETLVKDAEAYLMNTQHPNPYTPLMSPKGGLWGRNFPIPREALKPPLPVFEQGRNYNEEEMVVRHLHADQADPDFADSENAYAELKVARGEHVEPYPEADNFVYNPVVLDYCQRNGIAYNPNLMSLEGILEDAMQNVRGGSQFADHRIQEAIEEQIKLFDAGNHEALHKSQTQLFKYIQTKESPDQANI